MLAYFLPRLVGVAAVKMESVATLRAMITRARAYLVDDEPSGNEEVGSLALGCDEEWFEPVDAHGRAHAAVRVSCERVFGVNGGSALCRCCDKFMNLNATGCHQGY